MDVTDDLKKEIWEKAQIESGYDPDLVRKDACGAWMVFDQYGNPDSDYGWEIDHVIPRSALLKRNISNEKIDSIVNLRAFNCKNNKSKNDDYPSYLSAIISEDNRNVPREIRFTVSKDIQEKLKSFYNL